MGFKLTVFYLVALIRLSLALATTNLPRSKDSQSSMELVAFWPQCFIGMPKLLVAMVCRISWKHANTGLLRVV